MKTKRAEREESIQQIAIINKLIAGETLQRDCSRFLGMRLAEIGSLDEVARRGAIGAHTARRLRHGEPLPGVCGTWLVEELSRQATRDFAAGEWP